MAVNARFGGKQDWCGYIDFADTNSHYVYCHHRFQQLVAWNMYQAMRYLSQKDDLSIWG